MMMKQKTQTWNRVSSYKIIVTVTIFCAHTLPTQVHHQWNNRRALGFSVGSVLPRVRSLRLMCSSFKHQDPADPKHQGKEETTPSDWPTLHNYFIVLSTLKNMNIYIYIIHIFIYILLICHFEEWKLIDNRLTLLVVSAWQTKLWGKNDSVGE